MAKLLKLRRGTTTQHSSFTGAEGEVTVDTDKETLVVHDGSTAGGHPVAAEDLANVSSSTIAGRLSNDAIAVSKIAAGTLPSDVKIQDANVSGNLTIESADIVDGTIVNADVNASAAIAGTKISPDFGSQNIVTSGTVDGRDVSADGTKLDGIESGATADQTAAEIRTLVGSASDSNVFTDADHSKLDGIESGATGDQTAAEIRTLVGNASDSNVFTDADHSKLDGIESGATGDQTSTEIKSLLASDNLTSAHLAADSVGSSELADNAVDTDAITNSAVTLGKIQNVIEGRILGRPNGSGTGSLNSLTSGQVRTIINVADGANNYSHPNHSGEVTSSGDGATVIADNVVDEANLKVSNSPTNGYFLQAQSGNTGGLTWAQVAQPDLTNLSASNLTSGTIPDARFPSQLPTISGANLTNLAASALSGTLPALDGSNLTNLASACTRVKVGVRTSEYDLPHYNQGYLVIPGTQLQFTNSTADNVYLIYHGYQLRSTNAPTHTRHSRTVNAYVSGPSHGGQGHYAVYTAGSWQNYGPFMSINESRNTNDKNFGIYGRCTYYTDSYNSIQNVYLMVMEFKL